MRRPGPHGGRECGLQLRFASGKRSETAEAADRTTV